MTHCHGYFTIFVFQLHGSEVLASRFPVLCICQVDNVILRDPPMLRSPLFAGLNLTPLLQPQQQPCPGAWCNNAAAHGALMQSTSSGTESPAIAEAHTCADHEASSSQQPQPQAGGVREIGWLQSVQSVVSADAAWLQQVLADRSSTRAQRSLHFHEHFHQPPCQT